MAVTGVPVAGRDERLQQISRLADSSILHGSESLCKLLRYLATQSLQHPGTPIKEYQIATEVFGRPATFDPRLDSTVRVQTGRLRAKLADYYRGPGATDPVIVEIPKGTYQLAFQSRHPEAAPETVAVLGAEADSGGQQPGAAAQNLRWIMAFALTLGAALVLAFLLLSRPAPRAAQVAPATAASVPLQQLWAGFTSVAERPWVVFSNAAFVGRPETGMRYFNAASDSPSAILDHYTGVGEVLAVHELDRLFTGLGHEIRVKRGRLLSLDDANHNDIIFVGSPSENLTLRDIPNTRDFQFHTAPEGPRKGDMAIVNMHPRPGEARMWLASGIPVSEDYGVVALEPTPAPDRWVMILAGTTTLGTEAAAEFACGAPGAGDLLEKISGSRTGRVAPFEAVVRTTVKGGVPVDTRLVAVHVRGK